MIAYRTTGMFSTMNSQGLGAKAHRRKVVERNLAATLWDFAGHLAEHGDTTRAAKQLGFSASYGRVLLAKLKARMGSQAQ